jgi:hypothetical protein
MRITTFKIILIALIVISAKDLFAAPSRFECLTKLGNSATKEQLDSCVNGASTANLSTNQKVGLDTSSEEIECTNLGFKKKTEPFASCVLELLDRKSIAATGNDPDDAACRKYGFKPRTPGYSECRQKIDMFKAESQQRQVTYEAQKKQYDEQVAAIEKERKRKASMQTFAMGMGMLAGQTPMQAYGTSQGYPPAPLPPSPMNQTYVFPGGKMMNCTTVGSTTNCF